MIIEQTFNRSHTDAERTMHGPVHFICVRTMHVLQLNFTCAQRRYLSQILNSASHMPMCNQDVERDSVLKPRPVEQYYKRVERNRSKKYG